MFGNNPIRPREHNPLVLAVQSIFPTIQGEGPFSGQCATFIRLAGCNLACHYCDTEFESGIDNLMAVEAIVAQVQSYPAHMQQLVVLTGGEPLRQDIALLVEMLLTHAGSKTYSVQLETAGTLWNPRLDRWVASGGLTIVCSPKTPKINPDVARLCRHWKYIVIAGLEDEVDGLPNASTQQKTDHHLKPMRLWRRDGGWLPEDTVWVSPCDEHNDGLNRANVAAVAGIAQRHGYRVSLQIHKLLDVE